MKISFLKIIKDIIKKTPGLSKILYPFLSDLVFNVQRALRRLKLNGRKDENSLKGENSGREVLIIEIDYGGLGDSLLMSHLPRLAKESGRYSAVYLSNLTAFRNASIRQVVWELNPYVDGFVNKSGILLRNSFKKNGISLLNFKVRDGMNLLDEIMLAYGFDDGLRFHDPELYYQPKRLPEFADKVIFDPNWVTPLNEEITASSLERYFRGNGIKVDMQFEPRKKSRPLVSCSSYIRDDSFEQFCDIVFSCKEIYCFATGTAVLAAAIGKKAHVFYGKEMRPEFLFSRTHKYINLEF
jgi:hypothetical protein